VTPRKKAKMARALAALRAGGLRAGPRCRALREAAGLRQEDVAGKIRTTKGSISDWETEHRRPDPVWRAGLAWWSRVTAQSLGMPEAEVKAHEWDERQEDAA
jgi:transcriptional regulator with XRE-family HTH domain